jgi:hypothetical protein
MTGVGLLLWLSLLLVWPQTSLAQTQQEPADSTITLTKTVEVYTFEDLTFSIDSYSVAPGDNLAGILKKRGLWPAVPNAQREAQMIRLVKQLNPAIANPDLIAPGQDLYLPAPRVVEPQTPPPPEPVKPPEEVLPPGVFSYSLDEPPGTSTPAPAPEQAQAAGPAASPLPTQNLTPPGGQSPDYPQAAPLPDPPAAPAAPAARQRPTPPANEGPVNTASDGTVYRTVTIRKGDTLEKLLRREGVDPDLIYRQLIKITLSLNPSLRDPNIIVAGAEIRIPTQDGYTAQAPAPSRTDRASRPGGSPGGPNVPAIPASQTVPAAGSQNAADKAPRARTPEKRTNPKFTISTKRLPPATMPTSDSQNAKTILGVIFTRLGETFTNNGRLFLPLDEPPHFDVDTANFPVIELKNGHKIILDMTRALNADLIKRLRDKYPDYMIFQPTRGEAMEKVLERLWPMCAYYRIYNKTQFFEGGRDVKLKLAADWLIWPTAEAWNRGQPVVINLAPAPDNATPLAWVRFLSSHGITVVDLYKGLALAESNRSPTPINNFTVIDVDGQNPSAFAIALIKSFGFSPRLGVQVDKERGRIITGGAEIGPNVTPAVFWEAGENRTILEYGELSSEDLEILRRNNFNVISSGKDSQSVLKSVAAALGLKLEPDLVLNGDSTGGPNISLTISGQSFFFGGRSYLFTSVELPDNMVALDPNQNVVVLKYQGDPNQAAPAATTAPAAPTAPSASASPEEPTNPVSPPETGGQIEVSDL